MRIHISGKAISVHFMLATFLATLPIMLFSAIISTPTVKAASCPSTSPNVDPTCGTWLDPTTIQTDNGWVFNELGVFGTGNQSMQLPRNQTRTGPGNRCLLDELDVPDTSSGVNGDYKNATTATWGVHDLDCHNPNSHLIFAGNITLTNKWTDVQPKATGGTATWDSTAQGAAQITVTVSSGTDTGYNGQYNQSGLSGNVMTLTGAKSAGTCSAHTNFVTVGDQNTSYQDATTAAATEYIPSQASHGKTCSGVTIYVSISSYKSSSGSSSTSGGNSDGCPIGDDTAIRWVLCPLYLLADGILNAIMGIVGNLLYTPTDEIFGNPDTVTINCDKTGKCTETTNKGQASFQSTYNAFRNIGIGLLLIAGIIMVGAQAAGFEIFSPYMIRKSLPRIVFAVIGMVLAWPILKIVVTFFNDLGVWVPQMILTVSKVQTGSGNNVGYSFGALLAVLLGAGGALLFFGWGVIGFLFTAILILLFGLLIIAIVKLGTILLILIFPLAIACSVLPGTQKIWKICRDWLLGLLLAFPVIMGFLAAGQAASSISAAAAAAQRANKTGNGVSYDILAFIVLFVPYLLIGFVPKLIGGAFGAVSGMVNERGKGAFGWARNFRQGERKFLHEERMAGRRGLGVFGQRGSALYRRVNTRGGLDPTRGGRLRYEAKEQMHMNAANAKAVQENAGYITGDDTAMELAMGPALSMNEFVRQYRDRTRDSSGRYTKSVEEARMAYGAVTQGFGQLGSANTQIAAFRARIQSNTAYGDNAEGTAHMVNDANSMINRGLLSQSQAVGIMKTESKRLDVNKIPWGEYFKAVSDESRARVGPGGYSSTSPEVETMLDEVVRNMNPSELIGTHDNSIKNLAPVLHRRMNQSAMDLAGTAETAPGYQEKYRTYMQSVADVAQVHDMLASMSSAKANILADQLMGSGPDTGAMTPTGRRDPSTGQIVIDPATGKPEVAGTGQVWNPYAKKMTTISKALEDARGDPMVLERRREWAGRNGLEKQRADAIQQQIS